MLIPQSVAGTMFGDENPVGKIVRPEKSFVNLTNREEFRIVGVYRDMPGNSLIKNNVYVNIGDYDSERKSSVNYNFFVRLNSSQAKEGVEKLMNDKNTLFCADWNDQAHIRLTRFCDVYFDDCSKQSGGNRSLTHVFLWIAVLILGIAVVNYFNFSIAQVPLRIRSVNIRKVFGASQRTLRKEMVFESVLFFTSAYLIAVWGVLLLQFADPMRYLEDETLWFQNPWLLLWGLLIAAGIGALAGIYPACYATRVSPALVLKGSFGLSLRGRRLRSTLIGFQYFVSIALVISSLFMNLQYRTLCRSELGFDREQLVVVPLTEKLMAQRSALSDELLRIPGVLEGAYAASPFFSDFTNRRHIIDNGWEAEFDLLSAGASFPRLLGMKLYEGRSFVPSDERDGGAAAIPVLVNRTFEEKYGLKIGDRFGGGEYQIVGFVEDFRYKPLRAGMEPLVILCSLKGGDPHLFVRLKGDDYRRLLGSISKTVAALDPDWEASPYFFDAHVENQYRTDRQRIFLVTSFCLLAVLISLSGAFSLMLLETRYKRREIAVRRIAGASVGEMLMRFNRPMTRIVLVCFVLAAPPAWYGVSRWLEHYAVRTPLYWWVFASALVVVLLVTVVTVTCQSYRTANENPVRALKSE